jgi:dihydropteroate synthase
MHDFLVKEISDTNIENELCKIGFDKTYIHKAKDKFEYKNLKIFNLTPAQANILKQTAISVGADCGTHREVITGNIEKSDCLLGGSISQIIKIGQKLQFQPFGLKTLGAKLTNLCETEQNCQRTKIIGVLNITPDSFSDGGKYIEPDKAIEQLNKLIEDGADIIDIGAETTKPYSEATSAKEQIKRLTPVLEYIKESNIHIPISIDTRSAAVAQECLKYNVSIINDVSGLTYDDKLADVIAKFGAKVIIQHSNGTPDNMQNNPQYKNLMDEIYISLSERIDFALSKGIQKENIIIDPGIGFGKTREDNFEIIKRWKELRTLGCPVLIGISRKSLLGIPDADNTQKDIYTLALNSILIKDSIDYIRVHNVKLHKDITDMLSA